MMRAESPEVNRELKPESKTAIPALEMNVRSEGPADAIKYSCFQRKSKDGEVNNEKKIFQIK